MSFDTAEAASEARCGRLRQQGLELLAEHAARPVDLVDGEAARRCVPDSAKVAVGPVKRAEEPDLDSLLLRRFFASAGDCGGQRQKSDSPREDILVKPVRVDEFVRYAVDSELDQTTHDPRLLEPLHDLLLIGYLAARSERFRHEPIQVLRPHPHRLGPRRLRRRDPGRRSWGCRSWWSRRSRGWAACARSAAASRPRRCSTPPTSWKRPVTASDVGVAAREVRLDLPARHEAQGQGRPAELERRLVSHEEEPCRRRPRLRPPRWARSRHRDGSRRRRDRVLGEERDRRDRLRAAVAAGHGHRRQGDPVLVLDPRADRDSQVAAS